MKWITSIVCKLKERMLLLLTLLILLLVALFLLRRWIYILFYAYLALLILFGLIALARIIVGIFRKLCWKIAGSPKGKGSEGHPRSKPVHLPPTIYKKPDPMIYSQSYLMSKGLGVTWDNPDIQLLDGLFPVSSHTLLPGKTYTIQSRILNGSNEAAAVNMTVRFYYLSFGIGTVRNYIGETLVTVPVNGAAGLPAIATCNWKTPAAAGHYCIQVELDWPDDANPFNNLGQENVDVKKLNSPNAIFTFTLRNDSPFARKIQLQADSYVLPPKEPCDNSDPAGNNPEGRRFYDRLSRHRLQSNPVAVGWQVEYLEGNIFELDPGEERPVTIKLIAFDGFAGTQAVNVNAFNDNLLIGGVTLYAHS
ncbi:MAG TPA: hypothetical protein VGP55_01750 [Chitinophagaceae bacterium]|nr:hypothetical protein [Chitinophagaceae bacterium]